MCDYRYVNEIGLIRGEWTMLRKRVKLMFVCAVLVAVIAVPVVVVSGALLSPISQSGIVGAESCPNMDCTTDSGGTNCLQPYPANCNTGADCNRCSDPNADKSCTADEWDAWPCRVDPVHSCEGKFSAPCESLNEQLVCNATKETDLGEVACQGEATVSQCSY